MPSLAQTIDNMVSESIQQFATRIADTYGLDVEDIMNLWDDNVKVPATKKKPVAKTSPAKSVSSEVSKTSSIKSSDTGLTCPYVFARGENKGEVCGCKPKNGNKYCSKHKKYEGEARKEKKVLPQGKKSIVSPAKKVSPKEKSPETILRKHTTLDMYWHRETGMVFKSGTERIVVGKCVDDKLVDLTDDDVEVCQSRRWKYELSTKKPDESEEEREDEREDESEDESCNAWDDRERRLDISDDNSDKDLDTHMKKAVRKITSIPKSDNVKAVKTKKSITATINAQAEDVEDILSELQGENDSDEELVDEDDNSDMEEGDMGDLEDED